MHQIPSEVLSHGGRQFSRAEVEEIIKTAKIFSSLPRTELADTICEHLSWFSPTGSYKTTACLKLLEKLEDAGWFRLKAKRRQAPVKVERPELSEGKSEPEKIHCPLKELGVVEITQVETRARLLEWQSLVDRYHGLGYKKPFGCVVRYFIVSSRGELGCIQFAGAARALQVRDEWIGWTSRQRRNNLGWVVNNNRFLIFPWVEVKNLASHVLGRISRRLSDDWETRWGYRPVLLETFVDPGQYRGSSYLGAGWINLGMTSGRGLVRAGRRYETSPKMVLAYPLCSEFRAVLCSDKLTGRVLE